MIFRDNKVCFKLIMSIRKVRAKIISRSLSKRTMNFQVAPQFEFFKNDHPLFSQPLINHKALKGSRREHKECAGL